MSGAITFDSKRVIRGTVTIPFYGAWVADLEFALAENLPERGVLQIGDLTLFGTVTREATFAGGRSARLVGGYGGWRRQISATGYSHEAGIRKSTILSDAARACGEIVSVDNDEIIGTSWLREEAEAERTLHLLTDNKWWIDNAGVTQTKQRDSKAISTPFTVVSWSGGKGKFEIATENVSDWAPGRTFTAPNVDGTHSIGTATILIDYDGKLRIVVLNAQDKADRIREDIRKMIRAEIAQLTYCGMWEYTVYRADQKTIDATSNDSRVPDVTNCPMLPGLLSESVVPAAPFTGDPPLPNPANLGRPIKAIVTFINADPARPVCVAIHGGTMEHIVSTEALSVILYNFAFQLATLGLPTFWLAPGALVTAINLALAASLNAPSPPATDVVSQIAQAASILSTLSSSTIPMNTSLPFAAALAAGDAKVPNLSGLFPGIGCPAPVGT